MARNKSSKFDFAEGLNLFPEDSESASKVSRLFDEEALSQMKKASSKGRLQWVSPDCIDEDPDNRKIYGDYDTDGLSESIVEAGFRGVILVYPSETKGRFVIESGHRSLEAAVKAGMTEVPVVIGDAPADDIERRKRLTGGNQHRRKYTPMIMAREAQFQFETYEMEKKRNKELGVADETPLLEKVAKDMEISTSQVTKYRQLLSLIPELQSLVDTGDYNWAIMATASQLNEFQQKSLYSRILGRTKTLGVDKISGAWLKEEIEEMRYFRDNSETNRILGGIYKMASEMGIKSKEDEKKRARRIDGAKAIHKSLESLRGGISSEALIKDKARDAVLEELKEIRDLVNKKIAELSETK